MSLRGAQVYDAEREAVVQRYDEWGIEVFEVTDLAPWEAAAQTVIDDWISTQEEAGLPGQAVYDRLQELLGR
jgi:hypothetical protein